MTGNRYRQGVHYIGKITAVNCSGGVKDIDRTGDHIVRQVENVFNQEQQGHRYQIDDQKLHNPPMKKH